MDKVKLWFKNHLPTRRRLIQLYAALLYNAHLKGFADGRIYTGVAKNLCVPGLNCYSCPGAVGSCPLGALQNAIAGSKTRAPFYILGMLMLFGLALGRVVCGFLCPFGLIQELIYKIRTPKIGKNRVTRALSWLKYVILIVFAVWLPIFFAVSRNLPVPAFCKYICPAGTLEGAVGLLSHPDNAGSFAMLGGLFTWKFALMIAILAACVFLYRAFCRFVCPLGAIYGLFSKIALLGVQVDCQKCVDCGKCVSHCRMDVGRVGDHECIHCGACMGVCPTGAIQWKGPKKKARKPLWILAIAVLIAVLVWVNIPDGAQPTVGAEVGMICPDFTVPVYGGGEFSRADGRVTVINFWATWCGPCVEELPHFEKLQADYPDVDVVAVHSNLITEDVTAWLAENSFDLAFALDENGGVIASLGGSDMLPQTVIVNGQGEIVYNQVGSVTYDLLESKILPLMEE